MGLPYSCSIFAFTYLELEAHVYRAMFFIWYWPGSGLIQEKSMQLFLPIHTVMFSCQVPRNDWISEVISVCAVEMSDCSFSYNSLHAICTVEFMHFLTFASSHTNINAFCTSRYKPRLDSTNLLTGIQGEIGSVCPVLLY